MQALSRNKKIGIFSLVILGITLIGFVWTRNVDMSRLSSSVLNGSTYICTENGQKRNLNEYNKAIRDKQQVEGKIKIMSGEISTLNTTIGENKKTIAAREETIKNQNTSIGELTAYISKNCANPKTSREKTVCAQKKQQKTNLEQSNKNLSNQITSLNTLIGRIESQIKQKNENIATWTKKIEEYTKYIKEYDTCNESLKGKLIVTSPLMSGEVKMAFEIGKRAELYKFSMSMPAPGKAEINEIKFDTGFGPGNIELDDWYVTENSTATSIYPCKLENNGQFRCALERIESGNFGLENGRLQNYSLSAVVKDIKEPGSLKIHGISKEGVLYNETRRDADNQTTPVKIYYSKTTSTAKLTVTSPIMSGEVTMPSNEIVVLHTATVTVPKNSEKVQMESIDYILDIKPAEGLSFGGWHIVSGLGSGKCDVVPGGDILLVRCPVNFTSPHLSDSFIYPDNSVEYILKWSLPRVEFGGAISTSLVGIKYNGGIDNIDNQSTPVKINYTKKIIIDSVCGNWIKEGAEQCDDGNKNDEDGCSNICEEAPDLCILSPELPSCVK